MAENVRKPGRRGVSVSTWIESLVSIKAVNVGNHSKTSPGFLNQIMAALQQPALAGTTGKPFIGHIRLVAEHGSRRCCQQ